LTLFHLGLRSATGFDGLGQRSLVLGVEQRNLADVIQVKTDGVRHVGCFLWGDDTRHPRGVVSGVGGLWGDFEVFGGVAKLQECHARCQGGCCKNHVLPDKSRRNGMTVRFADGHVRRRRRGEGVPLLEFARAATSRGVWRHL